MRTDMVFKEFAEGYRLNSNRIHNPQSAIRNPQSGSEWEPNPAKVSLDEEEAHVWRVRLQVSPGRLERFLKGLSPEEKKRAGEMKSREARRHFVLTRSALRVILARYLPCVPKQIRFAHRRGGKPVLGESHKDQRVQFNVAHSEDVALIAVGQSWEIGVDVEWLQPRPALMQIAKRFFSPEENAILLALTDPDQLEKFYMLWCRKEACAKALGRSIPATLPTLEVVETDVSAVTVQVPDTRGERPCILCVRDLKPGPGYVGAVAVLGQRMRLRCFDFALKCF